MRRTRRGGTTLAILILAAGCAADQPPVKLEPVVVQPAAAHGAAPVAEAER